MRWLALLLAWVAAPAYGATPPNVVVVVLDDVGITHLGLYDAPTPMRTPRIDRLAEEGVRFSRVWSHPSCSPTRSAMLTGRWPFRYGIGRPLAEGDVVELPLAETTLIEALDPYGYTGSVAGKWHLAGGASPSGLRHPLLQGFLHHRGSFGNLEPVSSVNRYFHWYRSNDGVVRATRTYATTDTANVAVNAVRNLPEPFVLWLAFNAAHAPVHVPPSSLLTVVPKKTAPAGDKYAAMVEAADTELGRVLDALEAAGRGPTYVVVVGDNGTPGDILATLPDFDANEGKFTVYEGGVRVPLIVRGPGVVEGGVADAIVADVDLFPTLLDLAGVPADDAVRAGLDGVSFAASLADPAAPGLRTHTLAEHFGPNGLGPHDFQQAMVTDGRYKLVFGQDLVDELYDLEAAWPEGPDLLAAPTPETLAIRDELFAAWTALREPP